MQASVFEFRIRYLLHALVYTLAFWCPWNYLLHADPVGASAHVWGYLSAVLSEAGILSIGRAFDLLLLLGILFAAAGAFLRTWGAAYLGSGVVKDGAMHTSGTSVGVIADGPYRHLRNPLYLGTFLHTLALALLMPRTGAIFAIVLIGLMQVRLILGEEAFLTRSLGAPYLAYQALVPRLWPSFRSRVAAGGRTPHWLQGMAGEIYMIGVALSFATLGWRYNAYLLIQAVVVCFGLSLVARAVIASPKG
jgi:protein-S-isoprenylcysteine O-methyltransferase Ste14